MLERELELSRERHRRKGMQVTQDENRSEQTKPFAHSEDYRSVTIHGEGFTLTRQQAQMVKILHQSHDGRNHDVSITRLLEQLEKETSRWQDTFKSNARARKMLIRSGTRKGTLRLNL